MTGVQTCALPILLIIFVPVALIIIQNDAGTALVYSAFVWVLYREGMPHWVIAFLAFIVGLFVLVLIFNKFTVLLVIILLSIILFALIGRQVKDAIRFSIGLFGLVALIYGASEFFGLNVSSYYLILIPIIIALPVLVVYAYFNKAKYVFLLLFFFVSTSTFSFSVDYIFNNLLDVHHRDRINDLLGIDSDPLGWGYNVNQSKIAIEIGRAHV